MWLPLEPPLLETWQATQACALRIEPATLCLAGRHSIHWAPPARVEFLCICFNSIPNFWNKHVQFLQQEKTNTILEIKALRLGELCDCVFVTISKWYPSFQNLSLANFPLDLIASIVYCVFVHLVSSNTSLCIVTSKYSL